MKVRVKVKRNKRGGVPAITGPTRVKVGYPAGTSGGILDKAVYNHFGTSTIPERPFISNAIRDNQSSYKQALTTSAAKIVRGETDTRSVLAKLGIKAQGDIQTEITNLADPPNAPSTIAKKGSSNPLIDTGAMRNATTWKIDK